MTIHTALTQGATLLEEAAVAAPRLTAEVLLAHAIHCERSYLYSHPEQELTDIEWLHYGRYLHERREGKPTQYITQRQEFYGREFTVTPAVLIPRPETEHVVETALTVNPKATRILDVGCGSGALAVTLSLETRVRVWATDISLAALAVAAENARQLGATVQFIACDLMSAVADRTMDLVVANPPYVATGEEEGLQREVRDFEPRIAFLAGPTGFEFYDRLVAEAERVLRPAGWLVMELRYSRTDHVMQMVGGRWHDVRAVPDLAGISRVLACQLQS